MEMDPSRNTPLITVKTVHFFLEPLPSHFHVTEPLKEHPTVKTTPFLPSHFNQNGPRKEHPSVKTSHFFLKSPPSYFHVNGPLTEEHPSFKGSFTQFLGAVNLTKRRSTRHKGMWCFFSHTHGLFVTCVSPQLALLQRVVTPKQKHSVQPSGLFLSRLKYPGRHWSHS